jgi:hypothetical protein
MDTSGTGVTGTISSTVNSGTQTTITVQHNGNDYLVGTFLTPVGFLTSTTIPPGVWDMNLFASSDGNVKYYFDVYSVDSDGTSNAILISTGSTLTATPVGSVNQYINSIYVPLTILADLSKRLRVRVYGSYSGNKTLTIKFRDNTISHIHTSLQQVQGPRSTTGTWTVTTGTNPYSFTVPINGTYLLWVRGNIPNGIIKYIATVVVTNTNVPVLGTAYAWNYTGGGSPLSLTTIPTHIVGTPNTIINTEVSTTTANVFTFGISNTSGSSQTVYWSYTTF